jgi:hypothetical protein
MILRMLLSQLIPCFACSVPQVPYAHALVQPASFPSTDGQPIKAELDRFTGLGHRLNAYL